MQLSTYLRLQRGRATTLAESIAVTRSMVSDWASGKRLVPIERCLPIERATQGRVTRRDLRPDDWHLIWPELAASAVQTSQPPKEIANA